MTDQTDLLFLAGANIDPTCLMADFPAARFVSRAAVPSESVSVAAVFAPLVAEGSHVWGVVIGAAGAATSGSVTVTTDDGRTMVAALPADPLLAGDPGAVWMAARYWEFPPAYCARLLAIHEAHSGPVGDDTKFEHADDGA